MARAASTNSRWANTSVLARATRAARIDALKQASDFAKLLGVHQVQTHCGFIPENPSDPLYKETVAAIREVAKHCAANGQRFLMETGQETPTTMSRTIRDVAQPNLGDYPLYPKRAISFGTVVVSCLLAYGIAWLLIASVREHAAA